MVPRLADGNLSTVTSYTALILYVAGVPFIINAQNRRTVNDRSIPVTKDWSLAIDDGVAHRWRADFDITVVLQKLGHLVIVYPHISIGECSPVAIVAAVVFPVCRSARGLIGAYLGAVI